MQRLLLAFCALCFAPLAASAGDLPVNYTVDDKALKAAVAGTNITFDLYADSACAGVPTHTQVMAIENVDRVSRLKLAVPKGAAKPPKTAELEETLPGVSVEGNVYLKVTGTGITPVGGECQAQRAQIAQSVPSIPGGLVRSVTWNPTLTSAEEIPLPPNYVRLVNSSTEFPVGSVITAVSATLTGNLSGCPNWTANIVVPHDVNPPPPPGEGYIDFGYHAGADLTDFPAETGLNEQLFVDDVPQTLFAAVHCYNGAFIGDVSVELILTFIDAPAVID